MKNYFISYSRLDIALVKNIVSQIQYIINRNVWIDYDGIETASDFREKIRLAIDDCDIVLFMLSSNSMESQFAKKEVIYAKNSGKLVVPICIDNTALSGWFLFEFGLVDYVTYAVPEQKEKLFKDLFRWEGLAIDNEKLIAVLDSKFKMMKNGCEINRRNEQDPAGRDLREIGDDHYYGRNGNPIDYDKAKLFYEEAADLGDVRAINYLGNYCFKGINSACNYGKAILYYKSAANIGYAPAQNNLANCYYEGLGTNINYEEAVKWYKAASEQLHIDAICSLAECYQYGRGIEENIHEAFSLYSKAADMGSMLALSSIGEFYYNGIIIPRDLYKAFDCFLTAANNGITSAQYNVGYCYKYGKGVLQDKSEAQKWLQLAANNGSIEALDELNG